MAKAKSLSFAEFIQYAMKHYNKGGDGFVECWEQRDFDEYVRMFGPITKRKALSMFRTDYEIEMDRAGYF